MPKLKRTSCTHRWICLLPAILALAAIGCQSLRGPAQALATRGGAVARDSASAFEATANQLDTHIDREILRGALDSAVPPPTTVMRTQIAKTQQAYSERVAMLKEVAKLYEAFGALAAYDASAEVVAATADLTSAINALGQTLNGVNPIGSAAGALIDAAAGQLANADQRRRLLRTNAIFLEVLPRITELLRNEQQVNASVLTTLAKVEAEAALLLFDNDIGVADSVLIDLLGEAGLVYNQQTGRAAVQANNSLKSAIVEVLRERADRREARSSALAASTISALEHLNSEHKKFERGQPLDLVALTSYLGSLRALIDTMNEN